MRSKERFLGIDTGRRNIGWGVVELTSDGRVQRVDSGVYQPPGDDLGQSLYEVSQWTMALLQKFRPVAVGYEIVFFPKDTAPKHKQLVDHHTGAILGVCGYLPVRGYRTQDVKLSVAGYGRAGKKQLARAVALRLGLDPQEMSEKPDHETDALSVAIALALDWEWRRKTGEAG